MKKGLLSIILAVLIVMSSIVSVSALSFSDGNVNADMFPEDSVICEGNNITLQEQIEAMPPDTPGDDTFLMYDEAIVFESGTYVIDLNGFSIITYMSDYAPALIINEGANVTLKISSPEDYSEFVGNVEVKKGGVLTTNSVDICGDLMNAGTVTINNSSVYSGFITSEGTLTLNNAYIGFTLNVLDGKTYINGGLFDNGIGQLGGELYINGCTTSGSTGGLAISRDAVKTVITGGAFEPYVSDDPEYPYEIEGLVFDIAAPEGTVFDEDYIYNFIPDGYKATYEGFIAQDVGFDEETGLLDWYVGYSSVKVSPAAENYSEVMKRITDSDTWTIYADAPATPEDAEFLFTAVARSRINDSNYFVSAFYDGSDFNPNKAMISIHNPATKVEETYYVDVEYKSLDSETKSAVSAMLEKMKDEDRQDEYKFYTLSDLFLINYFVTHTNRNVDINTAINFTKDFINDVGSGKFTFGVDTRLGSSPTNFCVTAGGRTIVMYDGKVCATTNGGVTVKSVLYIPENTADTPEAYIAAAMKRITDYLGKDTGIKIEVGGLLAELDADALEADREEIDLSGAGEHFYLLTINGLTQRLAICKSSDSENFTVPAFSGGDLMSKITVKTTDVSVPLDTQVIVNEVKNDTIKKALGTDTYAAYDITLYSSAIGKNITKLTDGKFTVSIPVPAALADKDNLTVYYVADDGTITEHDAPIDKDGNAVFETDHFSTYAIAPRVIDAPATSPQTGHHGLIIPLLSVLLLAVLSPAFLTKKA